MALAGGKNKKYKRNEGFCKMYKAEGREAKNKARKQARHLKAHPQDTGNDAPVNYTRKRKLNPLDEYLLNNLPK